MSGTRQGGDNESLAILLVIGTTLCFSAGDIAAKALSQSVPSLQIAWMRYAVFAAIAIPAAAAMNAGSPFATRRPWTQATRGVAVAGSTSLFIAGLAWLGVPEATAINFISPVIVMTLAWPLLGEKAGLRRWCAAAVAFIGVLVVIQPGSSAFKMAALFPLGAAFCWAVSTVLTRMMADERPEATMAWSSMAGAVLILPAAFLVWSPLDVREAVLAALVGLFSTAGNWLAILALRIAPASSLAPFFYVQIVSAGVLSWAVLGMAPTWASVAGGALVAASGVYIAIRARRKAL